MSDTDPIPEESGEAKPRIPHDQIFKNAFSHRFQDLIELVDPDLAATLDLSAPKFLGTEAFTDFPEGARAAADLVAETPTRLGEAQLVLVHTEIEGEFRRTIDRRTLRYSMHLRLKFDVPVVSVVVFLTGGPPGVTRRTIVETVGALEVDRFTYLAFGLSGSLAEAWVDRPQPLAAALAALMRSEVWDNAERKVRCLKAVRRAELDEARSFELANIVATYIPLDPKEETRFEALIEQDANKEVQEMVITWEDALADSEARGEARGIQTGEALLLKRQLGRRCGELPAWVDERLEQASREELEGWADRVLEAKRLEDVFGSG
jgi:hypothetical protein